MTNHEINGTGAISIPNFIDAINSEGNGVVFWRHIGQWRNALIIDDVIRNRRRVGPRLVKAVKRRGSQWFSDSHKMHAANAYDFLANLDKAYYARTGKHIKEFTSFRNSTQKEEFMFRFMAAYENYKAEHPHKYAYDDALEEGGDEDETCAESLGAVCA